METDELYELVIDAVRQALADEAGGGGVALAKRMIEGKVVFHDGEGRVVKEIPADAFFRKVTAIREKLRVLEQKTNNNDALTTAEKAEIQALIARCYGSLTTFNFLFRDERDQFKGTGG
ncbi:MAG: hypothetical protein ACOZNI_22800 [Myxococcota bacterium]